MRPLAFAAASLLAVLPCCTTRETLRTPAATLPAAALADPLLLEQVPADAQVCVAWNVLEHPGYAGSKYAQFNALSQREPVTVAGIEAALKSTLTPLLKEAHLPPGWMDAFAATLAAASVHGGALYVRHFEVNPQNGPMPPSGALLIRATGEEGDALLAKWTELLAGAGKSPVNAEFQNGVFRLSINLTGAGEPWVKPEASLAANPHFKATFGSLGGNQAMLAYVDGANLVQRLKAFDAFEKSKKGSSDVGFEKLDAALGLSGLQSLAVAGGFTRDGQWQWNALIEAPAPRRGMLAMMDGSTLSPDLTRRVPASAESFTAVGIDLGATIAASLDLLEKEEPSARKEWDQGLDQAHQQAGIDIRAVLAGLGTQWLMFSDPMSAGSGIAATVVVSPLRDGPAIETNLKKATLLASALIKQQMAKERSPLALGFLTDTARGVTIERMGIPLVSPGYAVKDNVLYAGLLPQAIQGAVRPVKQPLTASSTFRKIHAQVVPADAQLRLLSYSDLPRMAPHCYDTGLILHQWGFGTAEMFTGQPADAQLPLLDDLMPTLAPSLSAVWTDAQGMHFRNQSPFPGSGLVVCGFDATVSVPTVALGAGILVPVLGVARKNANIMKDNVNTRNVMLGGEVYATSNKDWYPGWTSTGKRAPGNLSGLTLMLQESSVIPKQLTSSAQDAPECPVNDGFLQNNPEDVKAVDAWVRAHSSVIYIPDIRRTYHHPSTQPDRPCNKSTQDHQCITAFTDPAKALDPMKLGVVRGDSSVSTESQADLDEQLKEQYGATSAELAAEFRAGKLAPGAVMAPAAPANP